MASDASNAAATTPRSATRPGDEIWQATLLIASSSGTKGCSNDTTGLECTGLLDDDDFTLGGITYTVTVLASQTSGDEFSWSPDFGAAEDGDVLTLHVGTTALAFTDGPDQLAGSVVWAKNSFGTLTDGDPITVRLTRVSPPDAPTGLSATAGERFVDLTWTASADAGTSEIIRHEVCTKTDSTTCTDDDYVEIPDSALPDGGAAGGNSTSFRVENLYNTAYTFYVRAVNADGPSRASNAATATPTGPPLPITFVSNLGQTTSADRRV